ncbi:MAG: hypothetical protein HY674_12835 [Chloroflexi bacterium]|nr:hypothetical protein [Chloroflexota bacterium]
MPEEAAASQLCFVAGARRARDSSTVSHSFPRGKRMAEGGLWKAGRFQISYISSWVIGRAPEKSWNCLPRELAGVLQREKCRLDTVQQNFTVSTFLRWYQSESVNSPSLPDMAKSLKTPPSNTESFCRSEIDRMLKYSQTKVIMPVVTLGLLRIFKETGQRVFTDNEIRKAYETAVKTLKEFLGHDVHIGAKYYDAYGLRMSRYSVLKSVGHLKYELLPPYANFATALCEWIPSRIKRHIEKRLGVVPLLSNPNARMTYAEDQRRFLDLIRHQINKTPANFEIFSFAVIKVHLEKFACKIYRDTRTAAHDKGVDLSTNFGVVYQVKKLRICSESDADRVYAELKLNFDNDRLQDGNVILVIDDISKDVKKYLIDMKKVQSISKDDMLKMAASFEESEDRQKVLRIVYEEFRREYSSAIK